MGRRVPASFHAHCAALTDPRCPLAPHSRPLLRDILVMAVCAVSSGAEGWEDLEEYGTAHAEWRGDLLDWPQGMPGHATVRRVLAPWDPEALPQCFLAWTPALSEASGGALVSLDGHTLRHACEQAPAPAAIPRVRAWASAHRLGLGQRQVEEQSHAILALPTLRPLLALQGAVGTLEALGWQQEMAQTMTEQGADDGLALQDKHPTLSEAVTRLLREARDTGGADIAPASHDTVAGEQGRMETRRYGITSAIEWLGAKASWSHWPSVGMVAARRAVGDTVQVETRDVLTSLPAPGVRFAQAVRPHWGIEHSRHGVRDVACDEDAWRMRQDKGAHTFAVLRHIALHLLRREPPHKRGIKARRKRAGWDRDSLFQVLTG